MAVRVIRSYNSVQSKLDTLYQQHKYEEYIQECKSYADLNSKNAKTILPKITSCYRLKLGKPRKAIEEYEYYFEKYGESIHSHQLSTSLASCYFRSNMVEVSDEFSAMSKQLASGTTKHQANFESYRYRNK